MRMKGISVPKISDQTWVSIRSMPKDGKAMEKDLIANKNVGGILAVNMVSHLCPHTYGRKVVSTNVSSQVWGKQPHEQYLLQR